MSKLSFRARALDASKPMPIYMAEELPDLPDYSAINRAVPQMPSGMEKEEECEHHLQRAICAGLIIPTPEVSDIPDKESFDKLYPSNYKQPRQLIHMQPFTMEQDIPDYDMDSEDERWLVSQAQRLELDPLKFEEMMDRLEKSSGQTVVTLNEAKALLKEDDDLIIAVFDYWLNKRLNTQRPLILAVKTEHRAGTAVNNPYLAFRRRTEKMQTRKNRKNDETSYEKMLKLRRDLYRAVTLLELVKRREKIKREYVHLTVEIFEKRYQGKDFSGAIMAELSALKTSRPAFTQIFHNHYTNQTWTNKAIHKDEVIPRKEKRQYKKRKHKSLGHSRSSMLVSGGLEGLGTLSSDEEPMLQISPEPEDVEDEGQFAFRRNKLCTYHMPIPNLGNWPWCSKEENGLGDKKYRFTLTSLSNPKRCIGFARRRMGRGGRIVLDRITTDHDDFWRTLDFTITEPNNKTNINEVKSSVDNNSSDNFKDFSTNSFANLVDNNLSKNINSNNSLRTEIKSEFSNFDYSVRTSVSDVCSDVSSEIKKEPEDVNDESFITSETSVVEHTQEEQDEMVEFLETIRKDWLHFRPKTPPPGYEPPCNLLPADDPVFIPSANTPFSLELQTLDAPSTLLDTSTFITSPFVFEDFALDSLDIPVTDTRQPSDNNVQTGINLNVNVGLNTLTSSVNDNFSSNNINLDGDSCTNHKEVKLINSSSEERTIGCSKFNVSDINTSTGTVSKKQSILSSTLTSPKLNSVNVVSDSRPRTTTDNSLSNANGLVTQFGYDVTPGTKMKNNKIPYAYSSEVDFSSTSTSTLSLHTSAHTLTLNSHSANILEIPLANNTDNVTNKVNSQCTETSGTPPNNKNKTIVRKNNIVMEVT